MARVRCTPGSVLQVPVPGPDVVHAVMLGSFPYWAFYADDPGLAAGGAPTGQPLFVVAVERSAYAGGRWGPVVFRLGGADISPIPSFFAQNVMRAFFAQNVMRADDCEIVEAATGTRRPATPAECAGLERSAVWAAEHVESRLEDYFAGRPNAFVESIRLKL